MTQSERNYSNIFKAMSSYYGSHSCSISLETVTDN